LSDPTPPHPPAASDRLSRTLAVLRQALLALLLFGCAGTFAELLLLEHVEDAWQWTPVVLLGLSLPLMSWLLVRPGPIGVRIFQGLMILFVAGGFVGLWLHYQGNVEFEREMYPALAGWPLIKQALMGATPSLAPGTMVQFGLFGLLYTFRHPATARPGDRVRGGG
jgi:hypothetical protein